MTADPEIVWLAVYKKWTEGDSQPLAEWLRNPDSLIVDDAREFLADLTLGKVTRTKGAKPARTGAEERKITGMVYESRSGGNTHDEAIYEVAQRLKKSEDTVRGVVEKVRGAGITFDAWETWGRPKF